MKKLIALLVLFTILFGCKNDIKKKEIIEKPNSEKNEVSNVIKIKDNIKNKAIIAHRGTTFFAPEETEPAFLWARNIGADYLEFDVQLTKDNQLVAFHDKNLTRTTNVSEVFSNTVDREINQFTLRELRSLDAGSWFNATYPERARESFIGLKIMTLQDVLMFAEGYRIKKKNNEPVKIIIEGVWDGNYAYEKDPNDNGNRPGVYIETKSPKPGTEQVLYNQLTKYGWNINSELKEVETVNGKIDVANSSTRVVLQSFSRESILKMKELLPNIPTSLLLWQPDMADNIEENYKDAIKFCLENNVQGIGPSISGEPNNYKELTAPWMAESVHNSGLILHPYTFDTNKQLLEYSDRVDGVFTNRADLALKFYKRFNVLSPEEVLNQLGY